jgi:hypothetical protein
VVLLPDPGGVECAAHLNGQAVYGASAVGGVLDTFFAGALGLQQLSNGARPELGATLLPDVFWARWLAALAIWL